MQKPRINIEFSLFIVIALLALFFLYNTNKTLITRKINTENQIEYQQPDNRPKTGELDFKK